jgi:hypothetical protein
LAVRVGLVGHQSRDRCGRRRLSAADFCPIAVRCLLIKASRRSAWARDDRRRRIPGRRRAGTAGLAGRRAWGTAGGG